MIEVPVAFQPSNSLADAEAPPSQRGALLNAVSDSRKHQAPPVDGLVPSPAKRRATMASITNQFQTQPLEPINIYPMSPLAPSAISSPMPHSQPRPLAPQPDNTAHHSQTIGAPSPTKQRGRPRRTPRSTGPPVAIAPRIGTPSTPTGAHGPEIMMAPYSPHPNFPITPSAQTTHAQRQTEATHSMASPPTAYVASVPPHGSTHTGRKGARPQETITTAGAQPRILADEDKVSLAATSPTASSRPESAQSVHLVQQKLPPLSETRGVAESHRAQDRDTREDLTLPPLAGLATAGERNITHLELKPESFEGHGGPPTA
jgi:hypothetical protein